MKYSASWLSRLFVGEFLIKKSLRIVPLYSYRILTSNRSYLVPLETNERLSFMATPHQFLMLLDSPAKEAKFKAAKQASGEKSVFAFQCEIDSYDLIS